MTTTAAALATSPQVVADRGAQSVLDRLGAAVGALGYAHRELLTVVRQVLATGAWAVGGISSPQHWLTAYAAVSPATAGDLVLVARRWDQLPTAVAGFEQGRLTFAQLVEVARRAPATHEAQISEVAEHMTITQLRRSLRTYDFDEHRPGHPPPAPAADDPAGDGLGADGSTLDQPGTDGSTVAGLGAGDSLVGEGESVSADGLRLVGIPSAEPDPATAPADVSMWFADGRFFLRFEAPADTGALVEAALREAKDALFHNGNAHATLADALVQVATRSLQACTAGRTDLFRVILHLDAEGRSWVGGHCALPPAVRDKTTCDAALIPLIERDGVPVSVGRTQRVVPLRTRRLILDRDRGCRHPGCASTGHVEIHHIRHWLNGGPTDWDNLISLCPTHHDLLHTGQFTITAHPGGTFEFLDTWGQRIGPDPTIRTRHLLRAATTILNTPPAPYTKPTHDRLRTRWLDFGPPQPTPAAAANDSSPPPNDNNTNDNGAHHDSPQPTVHDPDDDP